MDTLTSLALEAMPNFVIVDARGIITYMNTTYLEMLGLTRDQVIGHSAEEVIPGTRLLTILQTGVSEIGVTMTFFHQKEQREVHVMCNRRVIRDASGKIIGALGVTTANTDEELESVRRQLGKLRRENELIKEKMQALLHQNQQADPLSGIIGNTPQMLKVKNTIKAYAAFDIPILITGETGVGKELFASAVQEMSLRKGKPFVKINCASIPKELMESELFGYEEGAFTGALKKGKMGKFELADTGTLLLDEIGEMPLPLQAKLLRVLQNYEIERVGGLSSKKVDVRLICSTNRDLEQMVQEGTFRQDLYYRINTVELHIPPLRERLGDLYELCAFLINKINRRLRLETSGISDAVYALFCEYSWPGNIRELEHVLERLAVLHPNSEISSESCDFLRERIAASRQPVPENIRQHTPSSVSKELSSYADPAPVHLQTGFPSVRELKEKQREDDQALILNALRQAGGNKAKAARLLGIDRSLLYYRMKKLGIE